MIDEKTDWNARGVLSASLKCWPRLTGEEAENLVEFFLKNSTAASTAPKVEELMALAYELARAYMSFDEAEAKANLQAALTTQQEALDAALAEVERWKDIASRQQNQALRNNVWKADDDLYS